MEQLYCSDNQLTSLDVSKNTVLEQLHCSDNQLTSLDVSKNKALRYFNCSNNRLTSLNLKNGNNQLIVPNYPGDRPMNATNNENLTCIQVDNVINANNYDGWYKDLTASYSTDCSSALSTDDLEKSQTKIYPNPVKNILNIQTKSKLQKLKIYSGTGQLVKTSILKETNVSDLPKGNYILKITTDKGVQTEKFIKE